LKHFTRRDSLVLGVGMAVTACGGGGGGSSGTVPVTSAPPTPTPSPSPTSSPTPSPSPSPSPTSTPPTGLAALAVAKGLRFGSTFAWSSPGADAGSFANPSYAALLERDATVVVPENELKWASLRPNATTFDFARADAMLAYAETHGMAMRGHNLLWYDGQYDPAWLGSYDFGSNPRASAQDLVRTHVQTVVRHYGTRIQSWDVVNEVINPQTGAFRTNTLSRQVGGDTSLLDLAFVNARQELPNAELVYNDYMDAGTPNHRQGVLTLLRGFKDRGIPVDTLGIQSHLGFYSADPLDAVQNVINYNVTNMQPFLDEVVAMGYKLKVTELDVNDARRGGTAEQRDAASAAFVRGWLDLMLSYPQLNEVLVWGMSDRYSWLQNSAFGVRADGLPKRPDPYDANFAAKPMRQAIADAFTAAVQR
jgi:endo-1,4-beta-xylanase